MIGLVCRDFQSASICETAEGKILQTLSEKSKNSEG